MTFRRGESLLPVATIGREREGLKTESALERSGREALAARASDYAAAPA